MEDEFRLSLLVLGTCFILAVLVHGVWKIRSEKKAQRKMRVDPHTEFDAEQESNAANPDDSYDAFDDYEDEIIIRDPKRSEKVATSNATDTDSDTLQATNDSEGVLSSSSSLQSDTSSRAADSATEVEQPVEKAKLYGSVVSNPKPHMREEASVSGNAASRADDNEIIAAEPPEFLLNKADTKVELAADSTISSDKQQASNADEAASTITKPVARPNADKVEADAGGRIEPTIGDFTLTGEEPSAEDLEQQREYRRPRSSNRKVTTQSAQMRIDLDGNNANQGSETDEVSQESPETEQEVLIINVRAEDGDTISGAALLPLLLTLGLKFGDQDIFHRHANANGKGPVLFSLANMFKPGNFDIDNLETFSTQGVSLFMILPIEGDAHQVFNMMHNAARKIADEFGAKVLDGRRSILTRQGLQQYVEKIREFERKRMVKRTS